MDLIHVMTGEVSEGGQMSSCKQLVPETRNKPASTLPALSCPQKQCFYTVVTLTPCGHWHTLHVNHAQALFVVRHCCQYEMYAFKAALHLKHI